ncbi:forkhead-associated domain-containing protein 1 isoform X2 [Heliangelus exortis]|uniref:forkhead-associated domain-containing protein 1 isoform X2 n=1 Tax=Heliangelus exortis TaxID=472823 RepID=UPI003A93F29B
MRAFLKSWGECFQLKPHTTTIGRSQGCDIVLQDFNSLHGTFVNGCQVQNAAVRVSPGDILCFGSAGASFQLVLDGAAQMPYPPVTCRTAWTGQPQLVAERKPSAPASPPHLPILQWQLSPSSATTQAPGATGHLPHPPLQKPPRRAWAWSVATTVPLGTLGRTSMVRAWSVPASGDGVSSVGFPSLATGSSGGTHSMDFLPQEKMLQLEKELGQLSAVRTESKQKEAVIQGLQEEVAAMAKMLAQAAERNKVELAQKLLTFNQELGAKKEEIRALKEQLETFKTQVMQACAPAAVGGAGKALTEQEVIEKVKQISEENQQSQERENHLQEELSSRLSKEKEVSANLEVFEKSLSEFQECLRSSCSSTSLRGALERLEMLSLDPSISAIGAVVVEMAHVPLSWLEGIEQLLTGSGMDPHTYSKGLLASLGKLLEDNQEMAQRNQMLQTQLEKVQETQAALLQERVMELEATHERNLQLKIQGIILGKDKENKEILENVVTKEKEKCKEALEEKQKKIEDLESHLRSLTEVMARKSKEQEASDYKLGEALQKLEEATRREVMLQQQVLQGEEHLRRVQEENELQRQELEEEMVEYKEQSKQHALTIVALEDRLLEAKHQQKMLEEEKVTLLEKMEGSGGDAGKSTPGAQLEVCPAMESQSCLRGFQEELAVLQNTLLSKDTIITRLTKELMETRARMSDMRGELSQEQKVELEQSLSRVKCQEQHLNLLREKLSQMSSLLEKKDTALQAATEELRQAQARCQALEDTSWERLEKLEGVPEMLVPVDEASKRETELDLANLGVKCRGLRHEETIQRQREGLAELRERIKLLEKKQSSAVMKKGLEPLLLLMKGSPEAKGWETGKEPSPMLGTGLKSSKVPDGVWHGAASSEVSGTMDICEKMYLDVLGALGRLMEVKELSGMESLKQLPREEREKVGLQRQKDLELLYHKIRNLKSCLERKEEMLKDYEGSMEQLRLNKASLRRCQEEMARLEDEAYREAEEKALLREALERTQLQLSQEKKLLQAARVHKPGAKKPFCSRKKIDGQGAHGRSCQNGKEPHKRGSTWPFSS